VIVFEESALVLVRVGFLICRIVAKWVGFFWGRVGLCLCYELCVQMGECRRGWGSWAGGSGEC
jgi:hypothetical protein